MINSGLMTIDELAHYLKVTRRTIYEWLKQNKIPAVKLVGQWRFKKDKIDVIQTREADVVVKYEEDSGYALIVITNKKNSIVEEFMTNFSNEFKAKYNNELKEILDINRIINVSEFSDLKELIEKNFQLYL